MSVRAEMVRVARERLHGWPLTADAWEDQMVLDCIKAFSETDFTNDQIVPIGASALLSSKLITNARLEVYKSAPHGMCSIHKDQVNADLLSFIRT